MAPWWLREERVSSAFRPLRSELCQQDQYYTLVPLGLALTVSAQNQVTGIIKTR